jgi:mannose-6-phosphate isomerase-like protein (cupin superfamily)
LSQIFKIEDVLQRLGEKRYQEFLRIPAMSAGIYVLSAGATDKQSPHQEAEIYYVVRGKAKMRMGREERSISQGDVIFVEKNLEHRFFDIAEELVLLVIFAPAEVDSMKARKSSKNCSPSPKKKLPKIVPPGSRFRLTGSDKETGLWKLDVGRVFRIGYYSQQDGLDVIWLVNEKGKYEQTTDRDFLERYFEPLEISDESDLFGVTKPKFKPL